MKIVKKSGMKCSKQLKMRNLIYTFNLFLSKRSNQASEQYNWGINKNLVKVKAITLEKHTNA